MSSQPKWKYVGNLGDKTPLEHGGLFVFVDETGVYPPEMELLEIDEEKLEAAEADEFANKADDDEKPYTAYRVLLEDCFWDGRILSDNQFHKDEPAWFAHTEEERVARPQDTTYLKNVADFVGQTVEALIELFVSDDPLKRATAWRAVLDYHGWENGGPYPLKLTRKEAEERYMDCIPT